MLEGHKHGADKRDFDGIIDDRGQGIPKGYVLLFYGLVIWGVLFIGYYLFSGWSSHAEFEDKMEAHRAAVTALAANSPEPAPAAPSRNETEMLAAGRELYAKHCRACHGAEGEGGVGPDLTAPQYAYGKALADVRRSIAEGRAKGMPGFGNKLGGEDVEAIARFVLSLQ